MATARSSQARQKRVQRIAEDAADKIAADSPLEEEVVVTVEELPPGESARTERGRSTPAQQDTNAMLEMVAQGQKFMADGISRWIEMTTAPFGAPAGTTETSGGFLDPRRLTEDGYRIAEAFLSSQKEFALKLLDAMAAAKAA